MAHVNDMEVNVRNTEVPNEVFTCVHHMAHKLQSHGAKASNG